MKEWFRIVVLCVINTLAGSRLAQLSDATWWQVTPFVLLVALWAGLWKHRARLEQTWSER